MIGIALFAFTGVLGAPVPGCTAEQAPWCIEAAYTRSRSQVLQGQNYEPYGHGFAALYRLDPRVQTGFAHEYRSIDLVAIGGVPAASNGDLHRMALVWRHDGAPWRYRVGAGLAVSSNVLKNPGEIEGDDLRASVACEYNVTGPVWLGVRGDDSFGTFRVYPTLEVLWRSPAHELRVGFPESSWRWRPLPRFESEIAAAPDGGRWSVRDSQADSGQSIVRYRAWEVAWALRWRPWDWLEAEAHVGRTFGAEMRYQLRNAAEARVEPADANFAGFGVRVRF